MDSFVNTTPCNIDAFPTVQADRGKHCTRCKLHEIRGNKKSGAILSDSPA